MCLRNGSWPRIGCTTGSSGAEMNSALRAAVAEDVGVLLGRQQRVEAHRHDAGLDGAPERHGKIDGIQQQQGDARLARDAVGGEQVGHAVAARLQLAVGQRLARRR